MVLTKRVMASGNEKRKTDGAVTFSRVFGLLLDDPWGKKRNLLSPSPLLMISGLFCQCILSQGKPLVFLLNIFYIPCSNLRLQINFEGRGLSRRQKCIMGYVDSESLVDYLKTPMITDYRITFRLMNSNYGYLFNSRA